MRERTKVKPLTLTEMNTIETAKMTKTTYFVEYVARMVKNELITYYQLVRTADCAILHAFDDLDTIYAQCFIEGISNRDVTIW